MRLSAPPQQALAPTRGVRTSLWAHNMATRLRVPRSRTATARNKTLPLAAEAESSMQEELVPHEQPLQRELGFVPPAPAGPMVQQVVAQAFTDVDRSGAGSLTERDLLTASGRGRDGPSRLDWVRQVWAAVKRAITADSHVP
jgi:hypothetical protein